MVTVNRSDSHAVLLVGAAKLTQEVKNHGLTRTCSEADGPAAPDQ